jgi:hypothetical protein
MKSILPLAILWVSIGLPQTNIAQQPALGLLKQPQIPVSGRFMCFIRAFLPMEVHRRIAGVIRLVVIAAFRFILRLETFQARPAFDRRAVHREMFVRQEFFGARQLQHCSSSTTVRASTNKSSMASFSLSRRLFNR